MRGEESDEYDVALVPSVPSGVLVDFKGGIKVLFTRTVEITYELTIEDLRKAHKYNEQNSECVAPPLPLPPLQLGATCTSMKLTWKLPQPPGIATNVEIQFAPLPPPGDNCDDLEGYPSEVDDVDADAWRALVNKAYERPDFHVHVVEDLLPGRRYAFRLRYRTFSGWSKFSRQSRALATLCTAPDAPEAPLSGLVMCESVLLFWSAPLRDNGRVVTAYALEGRSVGDEFVELYRGPMRSHLATGLHPEFAYSFRLAAINAVGSSEYSALLSVKTPPRGPHKRASMDGEQTMRAMECKEAWIENWDARTEQYFYFNTVTGTRQLSRPAALGPLPTCDQLVAGEEGGELQPLLVQPQTPAEREKAFRLKRYRLLRSVHKAASRRSPVGRKSSAAPEAEVEDAGLNSPSKRELLPLVLNRKTILADSFAAFSILTTADLRRKLKVSFDGEEAIDSGGVSKEAFLLLSKEAVSYAGEKRRGWLRSVGTGEYFPAEMSAARARKVCSAAPVGEAAAIVPSALLNAECIAKLELEDQLSPANFFGFLGRLAAKALHDRQLLDLPLSDLLWARVLGPPVGEEGEGGKELSEDELLRDVRYLDSPYAQGLQWTLRNDMTDALCGTFSVSIDGQEVALCADGRIREVNEENKREYVQLLARWKTIYSVDALVEPFLKGFYELMPPELLRESGLAAAELSAMLNGKTAVDVEELRSYAIYQGSGGFGDKSELAVWFWQAFRECSDEQRRRLLFFFTGSSRVPLDGFDPPVNITLGGDMAAGALPKAHTCFNQIVLPPYESYDILRIKLRFACDNAEGYAFA